MLVQDSIRANGYVYVCGSGPMRRDVFAAFVAVAQAEVEYCRCAD
jgi:sulfite reductase alpha subunit-like flavoprotein